MILTVIGVDIEEYSQAGSPREMKQLREELQELLTEAARNSDMTQFHDAKQSIRDTGDGMFLFIDTRDFARIFRFMNEIRTLAKARKSLRFRGIVHTGECEFTGDMFGKSNGITDYSTINVIGGGFNETARYLDSTPLKQLLKNQQDDYFVYGISKKVHNEISNQTFAESYTFTEHYICVKQFTDSLFVDKSFENQPKDHKVTEHIEVQLTDEFSQFLRSSNLTEYVESRTGRSQKLYVFPQLSIDFEKKLGAQRVRANEYFKDFCDTPRNVVISGSEQAGKTELAKELFRLLHESRTCIPVYLSLSADYRGKILTKINDALAKQYVQSIDHINNVKKLIIIDDFYLAESRYQRKIVEELLPVPNTWFVLLVDSVFNVNFLERELIENFQLLTIEEFSPSLRNELIQQWFDANGIADSNYQLLDSYTDFVNKTLMKGLVPANPMNLMVILAEKRAFNPLKSSVTSRGHCYQTLIYLALKKAEINEAQIDIYLNVLEHLAYRLFDWEQKSLTDERYKDFLVEYGREYNLPIEYDQVKARLHKSNIICQDSLGHYSFSSKYMFYFFVARYIADNKNDKAIRHRLNSIYNNLQINENGYIGVFIVHHLKDEDILEEVQLNLMVLYDKYQEATLWSSEVDFLHEHVEKLGRISMSAFNGSSVNRKRLLENRDMQEQDTQSDDEHADDAQSEFDLDAELTALRKALKTADVMGHILKTRTGSFKLENQRNYYEEALKLYMRITRRFLEDFRDNEADFLDFFYDRIKAFDYEKHDRESIYNLASKFYLDFNALNYLSCITRATDTLASEQILNVVKDVCDDMETPLASLVKLHAQMWHSKTVPIEEFERLFRKADSFTQRLIKQIIIRYCDLHDIKVKDKQKLAAIFDINLQRILSTDKEAGTTSG